MIDSPTLPRRLAGRLMTILTLLVPLAGARYEPASPQVGTWVLDEFSVTFFDFESPSRNELRDKDLRSFAFGGEFSEPGNPTYSGFGTLEVNVPDRIEGGASYTVSGRVQGDLAIAGEVPSGGEIAYVEVRGQCWDGDAMPSKREETRFMPGSASATLTAALAEHSYIAPDATPNGPASHNCEFWGVMHIGFATQWQVFVQAQYEPLVGTEPTLELDANPTRLPPSGGAPSQSTLTATVRDASGNPLAGERVEFRIDPSDMGRLSAPSATTNTTGEAQVMYTAPLASQLAGRSSVSVRAMVPTRSLEGGATLNIESTRLSVVIEPNELPLAEPPATANVRIVAESFDGRPLANDIIELATNPPEMGSLIGETLLQNRAVTDNQGVIELFYTAPRASDLNGLDLVSIEATNISHGGGASATIRFRGLHVVGTVPQSGTRDVELEPRDAIQIQLDRAIDPASVTADTVKLSTSWHGSLQAQPSALGSTIQVTVHQDPIPDVGLEVRVVLAGGEDGIRGLDGSLLPTDYALHFSTVPRLKPEVVISQVVDDPRDLTYNVITISPKAFVARVRSGLSSDSELRSERVWVELESTWGGTETVEHTFYPGDWPPLVPDDIVRQGNTANFVVRQRIAAGGHTATARIRPFFAPPEKAASSGPVTVNVSRWSSARNATVGIGTLLVPLQNDRIPGFHWTISRGQLTNWAAELGSGSAAFLPVDDVWTRLGYFEDTSCYDAEPCNFERAPWTAFQYWIRHVGRAGYATKWSYVMAVVPPGWFDKLSDHPDVQSNPDYYHGMQESGIWSDWGFPPAKAGDPAPSGSGSVIMEADVHPSGFVHALGDSTMAGPHSFAARDVLAGYDLPNERAIVSDGARWTGAYLAIMNEWTGKSASWPSRAEYNFFLNRWFTRACEGPPPCDRQPFALSARSRGAGLAQLPQPVPLIGVSGAMRAGAGGDSATLDPLIEFEGTPTLRESREGGTGTHEIVLSGASGDVLARYPFTPAMGNVDGALVGGYLHAIPMPPELAAVAVARDGRELAARRRSANAPVVTVESPAPGRTYQGEIDVAWRATDADGDELTYRLLASGDGGANWLPLLTDSRETGYTLDASRVPNGPDVRLRVVASDGFREAADEISIGLDSPLEVSAVVPVDGSLGVSPLARVILTLRDPMDPSTVTNETFGVRDQSGRWVDGEVTYNSSSGAVTFIATDPLRAVAWYEGRLTTGARSLDGRSLDEDMVWHFRVRGRSLYLPLVRSAGNDSAITTPTPRATFPGSPPSPRPTTGTSTPSPGPTQTALPTPTSSTLEPTASLTPPTAPTPTPAGHITAVNITTTSADAAAFRMAFAHGDALRMWVQVRNPTASTVEASFEFTVVGDSGSAPPSLAWRGPMNVPPGDTWFSLDRTVTADVAAGAYRYLATVTAGANATTLVSDFFVATQLGRADEFAGDAAGWTTVDDAFARSGWLDGAFQILMKAADYWRYDTPNVAFNDFVVEADVVFAGSAQGAVGLVGGAQPNGSSFVVFAITRDGRYGLFRRAEGAWQPMREFSPSPLLTTTGNHLMFAAGNREARMYANGRILATVPDVTLPPGVLAVYAEATDAGLDARFDNVRMYRTASVLVGSRQIPPSQASGHARR